MCITSRFAFEERICKKYVVDKNFLFLLFFQLLDNVRPPEWAPPSPQKRYNLVVIGAGTAGLVTASAAAGLGATVALVERHLMVQA